MNEKFILLAFYSRNSNSAVVEDFEFLFWFNACSVLVLLQSLEYCSNRVLNKKKSSFLEDSDDFSQLLLFWASFNNFKTIECNNKKILGGGFFIMLL